MDLKKTFETISPLLIEPKMTSITVGLSKRFFLFTLMERIVRTIEDEPYLNFISLLKYYKTLGSFLTGTVAEFKRDRDKLYFRKFFESEDLYWEVRRDIERLSRTHAHLRVTMTKRGLIVYDNYQKDKFNVLLLTIHSGTWIPKYLRKRFHLSAYARHLEEDTGSNVIYSDIVLKHNGIWIDNKQSRFACDMNRPRETAIYRNNQEAWARHVWKEEPSLDEKERLLEGYDQFYFLLQQLLDSYRFNIIFDGHTMRDVQDRAQISFGTQFIPQFYMPIVERMRSDLARKGYLPVKFNAPYYGGNILQWLQKRSPNLFSCFMEINKKVYMNKRHDRVIAGRLKRISKDIASLFDFEKAASKR